MFLASPEGGTDLTPKGIVLASHKVYHISIHDLITILLFLVRYGRDNTTSPVERYMRTGFNLNPAATRSDPRGLLAFFYSDLVNSIPHPFSVMLRSLPRAPSSSPSIRGPSIRSSLRFSKSSRPVCVLDAQQQQRRNAITHAISNPTLAGIEKRWEIMPPQEQAELWMALRDRMKADWHELTLQEKKAGEQPLKHTTPLHSVTTSLATCITYIANLGLMAKKANMHHSSSILDRVWTSRTSRP